MDKYVKGKALRRLQPTVARCGLEIAENNWHGALADSRITGLLLFAQAKLYSELFNGELVELQQAGVCGVRIRTLHLRPGWLVSRHCQHKSALMC